jgi:hypothetical protein
MSVREWFRKLSDPRGPLGEILSPSEVFKTRQGLPLETAHSMRADQRIYDPAAIKASLRPERFVAAEQEIPPKNLQRQVSRYVDEVWTPVMMTTDSTDPAIIYWASQTLAGYRIVEVARSPQCDCSKAKYTVIDGELAHAQCGRPMAYIGAEHSEDIAEHVQSINLAQADDNYNRFYETIRGPDSIMTEAGPAKGGTRIRGGRAEYRRQTKDMVHWDKGFVRERALAEGKEKQARKDALPVHAEQFVKRFFPRLGKKAAQ